jgi:hypothetical protein
MMENTFTYTARSTMEPERVVTFTLHDHHMSVELGGLMEHVERALRSEEVEAAEEAEIEEAQEEVEAPEAAERNPALAIAKPAAVSLLQMGTRPFHVRDVAADSDGEAFHVRTWVRAKGLRAAPVRLEWESVDNPSGAHAFVEELRRRKRATSYPGRFPGPMDYWISWFLVGLLALVLFWPRGDSQEQSSE